jgi:hypothetical protein
MEVRFQINVPTALPEEKEELGLDIVVKRTPVTAGNRTPVLQPVATHNID